MFLTAFFADPLLFCATLSRSIHLLENSELKLLGAMFLPFFQSRIVPSSPCDQGAHPAQWPATPPPSPVL